jgi:DNA-binding response OmpR family regulator
MRIVLVEDNAALAKGISYRLNDLGHAVDVLDDGLAAEAHLRGDGADLIILDINLPRLDGLSILRGLRERGDDRPVLLLTARSETVDRVRGLDAGADDYLVKPFEMDELEARVRALARRQGRPLRRSAQFGPMEFDQDTRQVCLEGAPILLPRREVSLVEILINAQGRTISKSDLLDHLYGTGTDIEEAAIEAHISRLRKRLKPFGLRIRVQRGLGYALVLDAGAA